jgi:hypothetical protein
MAGRGLINPFINKNKSLPIKPSQAKTISPTISKNIPIEQNPIGMNGVNLMVASPFLEPTVQQTPQSEPSTLDRLKSFIPDFSITPNALEESDDDSRFLASLIGQGAAMFGAGIAGRDPLKVAEQFDYTRALQDRSTLQREDRKQQIEERKQQDLERQRVIEQSKQLMDPNSDVSRRQKILYERVLGIKIPEEVSASDLKDPVILRGLQEQQMKLEMPKGGGVRQGVGQPKPEKEKKNPYQKEINEITIRSKNSLEALDQIEDIVSKYGTTEFTGPQGKILEQLIKSVAIDYNKVKDPNSVVRSEEAESVASSLGLGGVQGFLTSSKTALQQIKAFKDLIKKQKENALSIYQNPNAIDLQSNEIDFTKE